MSETTESAPEPETSPEVASTPEAVRTPEVASTPEVTATPEVASTPQTAATPKPVNTPEVVRTPEVAKAPEVDLTRYGRVAEDGTVYLTTAEGERAIGSFVGDPAAALAHFGRRYDELMTRARLVRDRLAAGTTPPEQAVKAAAEIRESLPTADVLGDLAAVDAVLAEVDGVLAKRKAERAQARMAATAVRRKLVEEAEGLVTSTSWNATGDRFKAIVEEWTAAGHGDRRDEDALWKRLSAARAAFGEKRRAAFLERDREREAAKERKEQLIREAEALSSSSEWTDTARKYRDLMDRWKAAGRAPKAEDDALWNRFRTAQDAFFARRAETFSARDAEFAANQKAKESLLERAERIDPRSDLAGAQALLRSIQADWEGIGKVPREVMDSLEARLEAVEDRVREASDAKWQRAPAQESGMIGQLRRTVAELEDKVERAKGRGDDKAAKAAEAELASKRMFLQMAEQAR
ncbi:MAG: hypothetical protein QOJ11_4586 [Frankiales bacterium]|jgi:hypothetical protein|nr:hypothetical protein [Frankiales bacterium]